MLTKLSWYVLRILWVDRILNFLILCTCHSFLLFQYTCSCYNKNTLINNSIGWFCLVIYIVIWRFWCIWKLILAQSLSHVFDGWFWLDAEVGKTKNGTLSLFPLSKASAAHKSVLVGDLKMANFKQFLANKGI